MNEAPDTHLHDWLLEAELSELREPPPAAARHLEECPACARRRSRLLEGYRRLDEGLELVIRPARARWRWAAAMPLAAAAVLALFLLAPVRDKAPEGPSPLLARLMFPDPPLVTPAPGQDAVVMQQGAVTVIWLTNFRGKR